MSQSSAKNELGKCWKFNTTMRISVSDLHLSETTIDGILNYIQITFNQTKPENITYIFILIRRDTPQAFISSHRPPIIVSGFIETCHAEKTVNLNRWLPSSCWTQIKSHCLLSNASYVAELKDETYAGMPVFGEPRFPVVPVPVIQGTTWSFCTEVLCSEMLPMVGIAETVATVKSKIMKCFPETRHKCISYIAAQFDKALLDGAPSSIIVSGFLQSSKSITKNTLEKMFPMQWTRVEKGLGKGSNHDKDIERKGSWETIIIGEYGLVGHSKKVTYKH